MITGLGIGDSLYFEALKRIGVARAMPISMGYPVLASLGAVVLLGEPLGALAVVGIALTLGGVYLVALPGRAAQAKSGDPMPGVRGYWTGVILAAAAAVSWSCSTLALGPALELVDVPTAGAIRLPAVSVVLWTTARHFGVLPKLSALRGHALPAILATGATTVAATALFLQSVALAGPGRAAVLSATSPLFAVPYSVLFLGERGNWQIAAGTVCTVIGVVFLAQS
jgi:drug/metabolite transporter (DMT)-like permease